MSRKLFEQSEDINPDPSMRIAFGKALNYTKNMTLTNFLGWLNAGLGFLRPSNNLSEVNPSTARSNLSVYSKSQIDTSLSTKGEILDTTGTLSTKRVLTTDNSVAFVPSLDAGTSSYPIGLQQPATAKMVLKHGAGVLIRHTHTINQSISSATPLTLAIAFPYPIPTSGYIVCAEKYDLSGVGTSAYLNIGTANHTVNGFTLVVSASVSATYNIQFKFILFNDAETNKW